MSDCSDSQPRQSRFIITMEQHGVVPVVSNGRDAEPESLAEYVKHRLALNSAYRQSIGIDKIYAAADEEMKGEYSRRDMQRFGEDAPHFNILAMKYADLMAVVDDVVSSFARKPWKLRPTPISSLPESTLRTVATRAYEILGALGSVEPERRLAVLRAYKRIGMEEAQRLAKAGAEQMERSIYDDFSQTGWEDEYKKFFGYLGLYPVAYMVSPNFQFAREMWWGGDNLQMGRRVVAGHKAIHPASVFPSPDCKEKVEKCDNVIIVESITRASLYDLIENEAYDGDEIKKLIRDMDGNNPTVWWDESSKVAATSTLHSMMVAIYDEQGSVPLVRFNGKMTGAQLKKYKVAGKFDTYKVYEVEAYVIGEYVIRVAVNPYPLQGRPIHAERYRPVPGKLYGQGLYQILKESGLDLRQIKRTLFANMHEAAESILEVNRDRLPGKIAIEDVGPGSSVPVKSDPYHGNGSTFSHKYGQNLVPTLLNLFNHELRRADEICGIPSQLTGFANAPGANRTEGVFATGLANALKSIKELIGRVDRNIVRESILMAFQSKMVYSNDVAIRFDAAVIVDGTSQIQQRDAVEQQEGLILQTLMQGTQVLSSDGQPLVSRDLWDAFAADYFSKRGIDAKRFFRDPDYIDLELGGPVENIADTTDVSAPLPELDGRNQ